MQTSCAPSPSTRKRAAEGQLDLCLPQRVACEVWYHRNARSNQKNHVAMADACSRAGRRVQVRRSARACGRVQGRMGDLEDCARAKAGMDMRPAGGCVDRCMCGGRRGGRVRRAQGRAGSAVGRSGRVRTNEQSRALEPMRAFKPVRHAGGGCQTATVAHQRPRFKTAPTTSRAAPNRTSTASTSNVNEKPARKSSGRPSI